MSANLGVTMLSVSITSALLAIGGAGTIYLDFLDARNFEQIREACEPGFDFV